MSAQSPPDPSSAGLQGEPTRVELSAESIYDGTPVVLMITSPAEFAVVLPGRVIDSGPGLYHEGEWVSEPSDGAHRLRLVLLDWIAERQVRAGSRHAAERYGMRYYPFVSSSLVATIEFRQGNLGVVGVQMPPEVRLMWFQGEVRMDGEVLTPIHVLGEATSRWIYAHRGEARRLEIDLRPRLGGSEMAKVVDFPLYYWVLSLGGLVIAARAAHSLGLGVVVTAIAALWTAMLRQWSSSKLPQQNTILTFAYGIAAIAAALWAGLWVWSTWAGLLATVFYGLATVQVFAARRQFARRGTLPRWLFAPWSLLVSRRIARDAQTDNA